ncbi:uncharacterized protein LOC135167446 [Diachasmimorpha longicaudata]|uniref:uncharacterized protein LOC135167446 n=1 Tax=Diachasmimorpha longicaudata TaxID=58733 RepID=UPI0030B918D7
MDGGVESTANHLVMTPLVGDRNDLNTSRRFTSTDIDNELIFQLCPNEKVGEVGLSVTKYSPLGVADSTAPRGRGMGIKKDLTAEDEWLHGRDRKTVAEEYFGALPSSPREKLSWSRVALPRSLILHYSEATPCLLPIH